MRIHKLEKLIDIGWRDVKTYVNSPDPYGIDGFTIIMGGGMCAKFDNEIELLAAALLLSIKKIPTWAIFGISYCPWYIRGSRTTRIAWERIFRLRAPEVKNAVTKREVGLCRFPWKGIFGCELDIIDCATGRQFNLDNIKGATEFMIFEKQDDR